MRFKSVSTLTQFLILAVLFLIILAVVLYFFYTTGNPYVEVAKCTIVKALGQCPEECRKIVSC